MERVAAYIDGFNLYNGIMEAEWRHYLWLDLRKMVEALLLPEQELVGVTYYTARVGKPFESVERQRRYLDALEHRDGLTVVYGTCVYEDEDCKSCGRTWSRRTEKKTDVGIAVGLLTQVGRYDAALLISGDSDLVPAVNAIEALPNKRVINAAPPRRVSKELKQRSSSHFVINETTLRESQFPSVVSTAPGYAVVQPVEWCADPDTPLTR